MKRNDDILRYLSDFMSENEKLEFEKELSVSEELRNQVAEKKSILENINVLADIKEDSPYFQNLLPRVRAKVEKKKSTVWVPRWAYLLVSTTAVILIVVNIGRFTTVDKNINKQKKQDTSQQVESLQVTDIYPNYNLIAEEEVVDASKASSISFDVSATGITNKESIKEIAKSRLAYPVEDYLLALR